MSSALQEVSGFCGEQDLNPADDPCPCLSSQSVAYVVSRILTLLMTPVLSSQNVSGLCGELAGFGPG